MTTQTFASLISRAYYLSGVIGENETMSASQASTGLLCLNELIDSWNADNLNIFTINILMIPTVGGQQSYAIGPGGDFNVPVRPPAIAGALFRQTTVTPYVDLPIEVISEQDWGNVTSKGITGNISQYGYYDQAYPLGNFNIWPIPNSAGGNLILHVQQSLNSSNALTDVVSLPPAYAQALRFNLAMLLCAENGIEPSVTVLNTAVRAKRLVEENNGQMLQRMSYDAAAMGANAGRYMIQSDSLRV